MDRDWQSAQGAAFDLDASHEFLDQFSRLCESEVRPVMEAVATRLSIYGGGGIVEMRRGGNPRRRGPRLTMWLSLKEEMVVFRAQNVTHACVSRRTLRGVASQSPLASGHPRIVATGLIVWQLSDVTQAKVTNELTDIIGRLVASL